MPTMIEVCISLQPGPLPIIGPVFVVSRGGFGAGYTGYSISNDLVQSSSIALPQSVM